MNISAYSSLFCTIDPLLVPLEPIFKSRIEPEEIASQAKKDDNTAILSELYQLGVSARSIVEILLANSSMNFFEAKELSERLKVYDNDALWQLLFSLHKDLILSNSCRDFSLNQKGKLLPEKIGEIIKNSSNIVILVGAGISVSANIPDFRSENGIYATIKNKFPLQKPEDLFNYEYVVQNPFHLFHVFCEMPQKIQPTKTHNFMKRLEDESRILRVYTQNIDCLELSAGLDPEKVVQVHGSLNEFKCSRCEHIYADSADVEAFWELIRAKKAPYCPKCSKILSSELYFDASENYEQILTKKSVRGLESHLLIPNIVFFDDNVNELFHDLISYDCDNADLFIIMGTSLSVSPVCGIVGRVPKHIPQLYINKTKPSNQSGLFNFTFYEGECDDITTYIDNIMDGVLVPFLSVSPVKNSKTTIYQFNKINEA